MICRVDDCVRAHFRDVVSKNLECNSVIIPPARAFCQKSPAINIVSAKNQKVDPAIFIVSRKNQKVDFAIFSASKKNQKVASAIFSVSRKKQKVDPAIFRASKTGVIRFGFAQRTIKYQVTERGC